MDPSIQAKFKPIEQAPAPTFSDAKVNTAASKVIDSTDKEKTSFKDLLGNSNDDMIRARVAQKNGDAARMAKTDEEFAKAMLDKANAGNVRKPQNELDKDAFLKLFVTQMRNQDPLSPDNSAQMAAQLAQFHGLEQMMNVNKNLEKMQGEEALGRAVGLINFVGKDIKLDNGKLLLEHGRVATDAVAKLDGDAAKATLEVRDASGVVVATQDMGHLVAGEHKIEWDGVDKDGKHVTDGAYSFALLATDELGQQVSSKIVSNVRVDGVDLHDQGGSFFTPIGKVRVNEVASVGELGFGKAAKPAAAKTDGPGAPNGAAAGSPQAATGGDAGAAGNDAGGQSAPGHGASEPVTTAGKPVPSDDARESSGASASNGPAPRQPLATAALPGESPAAAAGAASEAPVRRFLTGPAMPGGSAPRPSPDASG